MFQREESYSRKKSLALCYYISYCYIGILHPSGEPILQQLHRCSPLEVGIHIFVGRCFAVVVISARE